MRKQDMMAAMEHRQPVGGVPIWEIEFQAWDAASGRHVILGHEVEALPMENYHAMIEAWKAYGQYDKTVQGEHHA